MKTLTHPQYSELSNRIGQPEAYMDELLDEILYKIEVAINEDDNAKKENILFGIHNYLAGMNDGIRFNRPCPYSESNPKVFKRRSGGGRILGC